MNLNEINDCIFAIESRTLENLLLSSGSVDHYLQPKALPTQTFYLDNLALNFGSLTVDKFEAQLCARLNKDRLSKDRAEDDGKTVTITERRLMV